MILQRLSLDTNQPLECLIYSAVNFPQKHFSTADADFLSVLFRGASALYNLQNDHL